MWHVHTYCNLTNSMLTLSFELLLHERLKDTLNIAHDEFRHHLLNYKRGINLLIERIKKGLSKG